MRLRMCGGSRVMSLSLKVTRPEVGRNLPLMMLNRVVLPAPVRTDDRVVFPVGNLGR